MNKDIKVVAFTKLQLKAAIHENLFWKTEPYPISKNKAIWLTKNDRMSDEDTCIVLGLDKDKIISFILIIPDFFLTHEKKYEKKYWFSYWWLDEAYRSTGIAALVFFKACKAINNQIFISAYSNSAGEFYDRLNQFNELEARINHFLFFTFDGNMVVRKFRWLRFFKFIIYIINFLLSCSFRPINILRSRRRTKHIDCTFIDQIDEELWQFIKPRCSDDFIEKTQSQVNWHLDNHQYDPKQNPEARVTSIKLTFNQDIIGFLSYVQSRDSFEVKYFIAKSKNELNLCVDTLVLKILKSRIKFVSTYNNSLSKMIKERYLVAYEHLDRRKAIVNKAVEFNHKLSFTIKDCEGA